MSFEDMKKFVGEKIKQKAKDVKVNLNLTPEQKRLYKIFKSKEKEKSENDVGYKIPSELLAVDFFGGHLPEAIYLGLVEEFNDNGYISEFIGEYLQGLMYDKKGNRNNNDIYIKTSVSSVDESIFETGVRCFGHMVATGVKPSSIEDIQLNETIEAMPSLVGLIGQAKTTSTQSKGSSTPIDTTLILSIPRGTAKEDILYYNKDTDTFNIKPQFVMCSIPISQDRIVNDIKLRDDYVLVKELNQKEKEILERDMEI